ncbi:GntR family transcriptional regulator [Brevibacterium marinum]|uniref:DNA-binding GntR family transcriptional regulator n=1 Tax=Brevibacterium marinum TaxID=418643 RepID=A0A846RN21_9MICO|nr:DNA-binding GntR family transcriptional regulator [Brevibacterium marinum]
MTKTSMADQAYAQLKRDIVKTTLRPGTMISDSAIAEEYEMSRTPVREAINSLRREGLVVVMPRRGTFVKPIDFSEIQDLYALRKMVEPEAAVLASERASSAELEDLAELSELSTDPSVEKHVLNERNGQLHVRIAELSGVPVLAKTVRSIHEEIERCLNLRKELGRPYKAVNHGRLVDAIESHDPGVIRDTALQGIERARSHMMTVLTSHSGSASALYQE